MKPSIIAQRLRAAGSLYAFGKSLRPDHGNVKKKSIEAWTRRHLKKRGIAIPKEFSRVGRKPFPFVEVSDEE